MPFIKAKLSSRISKEQEAELKAGIGKAIGGLSINMNGFSLFNKDHRSSKPLCLAYKAAQLAAPEKADHFLVALRHATVIDCLPTTHFDIILRIAEKSEIDQDALIRYYRDGSAKSQITDCSVLRSPTILPCKINAQYFTALYLSSRVIRKKMPPSRYHIDINIRAKYNVTATA